MGRYAIVAMWWVGVGVGGRALAAQEAVRPAVKVEVAATEPGIEATLGRGETFWVRVQYESDEPVKLWARPYFNGKEAPAASNPSRAYVGSGYALGWFSFRESAEVDEIRINAGGGKPYREWTVASYPVKLRWTVAAAAPREPAPWVAEMRAADAAAQRAAMDSLMNEPVTASDIALMRGIMLVVLGGMLAGILAPILAYRKWKGGWRVAACVPLVIVIFISARIIVGTAVDPTSHNLWPFEIGMAAFAALAFITLLVIARRVVGAHRD